LPVVLQREIPAQYPAVSGAPVSSSGLEAGLAKITIEKNQKIGLFYLNRIFFI